MAERKKVNRDEQRRARAVMDQFGVTYMQALNLVRTGAHSGAAAPSADRANGDGDAVAGWLKSLHYRWDGWTIAPGEEAWISDIGRFEPDGTRKYRADGTP